MYEEGITVGVCWCGGRIENKVRYINDGTGDIEPCLECMVCGDQFISPKELVGFGGFYFNHILSQTEKQEPTVADFYHLRKSRPFKDRMFEKRDSSTSKEINQNKLKVEDLTEND